MYIEQIKKKSNSDYSDDYFDDTTYSTPSVPAIRGQRSPYFFVYDNETLLSKQFYESLDMTFIGIAKSTQKYHMFKETSGKNRVISVTDKLLTSFIYGRLLVVNDMDSLSQVRKLYTDYVLKVIPVKLLSGTDFTIKYAYTLMRISLTEPYLKNETEVIKTGNAIVVDITKLPQTIVQYD